MKQQSPKSPSTSRARAARRRRLQNVRAARRYRARLKQRRQQARGARREPGVDPVWSNEPAAAQQAPEPAQAPPAHAPVVPPEPRGAAAGAEAGDALRPPRGQAPGPEGGAGSPPWWRVSAVVGSGARADGGAGGLRQRSLGELKRRAWGRQQRDRGPGLVPLRAQISGGSGSFRRARRSWFSISHDMPLSSSLYTMNISRVCPS